MSATMIGGRVVLFGVAAGGSYLFGNGSASAPSIAFASDPNTGFYRQAEDLVGLATGGIAAGAFGRNGAGGGIAIYASGTNQNITLNPSGTGYFEAGPSSVSSKVRIGADAGNSLYGAISFNGDLASSGKVGFAARSAGDVNFYYQVPTGWNHTWQVNGVVVMRMVAAGNLLLGTTTDSANGRLQLATHTDNTGGIGFGTDVSLYRRTTGCLVVRGANAELDLHDGTALRGEFYTQGNNAYLRATTGSLFLGSAATVAITIDTSQNASFAGSIATGSFVQVAAGSLFAWNGRSRLSSPSSGVITLLDSASTDFSRLQFGGTTNSFPALKRSGNQLQARLADDSSSTSVQMSVLELVSSVVVRAGSGTPEGAVTAVIGSLFLRTDGGASTTLYVKVSGTGNTGWVAK